ncbi:NAD-dependent succinate-semialdehyde dehydrogenase [Paraburkholderia panacisoli]|uniref:NAD-dependent succinate-semialdehyde dehydrogenase n=1 Tax=Paraburkholderia panacisoli TaxID=2603818 RepID=A0A5B0HLS1_9BURK|nr:NAD-dependent succinate-semialdehyde dehydrogenase [Paraburkholderia panacisoli]KAA1016188.1 NAD-dependent succinate-semialdehyde dehydrogenase [Paraburkholderia panacisoli]
MKLQCSALFQQSAYVAGSWVDDTDLSRIPVTNPATGEVLGSVPQVTEEHLQVAISSSAAAFQEWRDWSSRERASVLKEWASLVLAHREDLAMILCLEQGKPLHEARAEISQAANYLEWFGEEARRIYGDNIPAPRRNQRIRVLHQPIGVCGALTSWTFPSSMVARRLGAALAAGCSVVHHPDPKTPFSALALCLLGESAGLPRGVLSVLTGAGDSIGLALASSPAVRKVSFTGTVEDGKRLMAMCASTVKKVSLELGANCAFIVFNDADVDLAVKGALDARFRHSGQAAMCANRFFVHEDVYESFVSKLVSRVAALKVRDGLSEGAQIGPLINDDAVTRAENLVNDAVQSGALILTGGSRLSPGSNFFRPTVLTNVEPEMSVCGDEVLAPIANVLRFTDEAQVIDLANNTRTGLAAYFYTSDISRAFRVMEALETGVVGVNDSLVFNEVAPFGGIKESGMGREGAHSGVEAYLEAKYVCFGNL